MGKLINQFSSDPTLPDDFHLVGSLPDNAGRKVPLYQLRELVSNQVYVLSERFLDSKYQIETLEQEILGISNKLNISANDGYARTLIDDLRHQIKVLQTQVYTASIDNLRTLISDLEYKYKLVNELIANSLAVKTLQQQGLAQNQIVTINNAYEILQIYERQPGGNVAPSNMTNNTTPAPYVASAVINDSLAFRVFDGLTSTDYQTSTSAGGHLQIDLGANHIVESYAIAPSSTSNVLTQWNILSSTDGLSFVAIDSRNVGSSGWSAGVFRSFTLPSATTLRFFRLQSIGPGIWRVGELRIFGTGFWQAALDSNYQITCNSISGLQSFAIKKLSTGSVDVLVRYL